MDSIRAPWGSPGIKLDDAYAQAFVEFLLQLSFGRNLVVQQSFALDSHVFQLIFRDFTQAYSEYAEQMSHRNAGVGDKDFPVMLHLLSGSSFREAVCIMLERIISGIEDDPKSGRTHPFHSSLYPDLNDVETLKAARAEIAEGNYPSRFISLLDQTRAQLFDDLWGWFGTCSGGKSSGDRKIVRANPGKNLLSMKQLLSPILDVNSELAVSLRQKGYDDIPAIKRVTEALRALDKEIVRQEQFGVRSFFYGSWVWGSRGGSVEEIVGEALPDVREVVNTLYSRVTVHAVGATSASYSTPMVPPIETGGQFTVQQLALWSHDFALRDLSFTSGLNPLHAQSRLEVGINGSLREPRSRIMDLYGGSRAVDAFRRVLFLRTDPSWKEGIAKIRVAQERGDLHALEEAIDEHVDLVARALSGMCNVDRDERGAIRVVWRDVNIAAGTFSAASAELFGCMELKTAQVVAAGAAVTLLGPPLVRAIARPLIDHRDYGKLRNAFGQVVSASENPTGLNYSTAP